MYIGIDLGTSNSAVAGYANADIRVYKTAEGSDTLPSVIYADKRGHKLYGKRAYDQKLLSPENVASGFKRQIGTSTKIELKASKLSFSPEECSADILKQLLAQAYTESGEEEIYGTVITIPAAFNQMQSEGTIRAAKLAGIDRVALLPEPIAAAMAAMASSKNKNGQFLVYDLGGGTFDLALVQSISGAINVIAHEGINMLGGIDFDRAIVNSFVRPWLLENFDLPNDFQKHEKYRRVIRIAHLSAEKSKIALSTKETDVVFASDDEIRVKDDSGQEIYLEVELARTDLEYLVSDEINKTVELSRKILKDNGYGTEDIDRIVFIGGPTKMPCIRNGVTRELGIPSDLTIDPMTAVAQGAAIYCESRSWDDDKTSRKASRASHKSSIESLSIKYDYPARSPDEKARIRLTSDAIDEGFEVQIDSATGWTSGRVPVAAKTSIELQLTDMGENLFTTTIYDAKGKPLNDLAGHFAITRTHASSVGIPATQTIAVKVRASANSIQNTLVRIIEKGTALPATGDQHFRAARRLNSNQADEYLDFELYQDEGVAEAELNLCIGVFRILGSDLEEGMQICEGDEIIFHWEMSDSGLLKATVDLPAVGQSFDTPKFYVDQAGHQSFDLETGERLAKSVLENAESDLNGLKEAVGDGAGNDWTSLEKDLSKQYETLESASEGDTMRAVTEQGRRIRQQISRLKNSSVNRARVLHKELDAIADIFDRVSRESCDERTVERFDAHKQSALNCFSRNDQKSLDEAQAHIGEMGTINHIELLRSPDFLLAMFANAVDEAYLAADTAKYELLLRKGNQAIEDNNVDELRTILFALSELRVSVSGAEKSISKLASIFAI